MNQDLEHLSLLGIFHFVAAAATALFACIPLIHFALGIAMISGAFGGPHPPPPVLGWMFVLGAGFFIGVGWALALAMLLSGLQLRRRRGWTFCFVIGALECVIMPYGTVLGVFTLIVLSRPSVKALFGLPAVPSAPTSA